MLGVGIGGVVGGTVLACKATRKLDPIIEDHNKTVEEIHEKHEETESRDLAKAYIKTGVELTKLYLPSGLVLIGSVGCIVGSHTILSRRNVALGAAYAALDSGFKEYRKNIIEKYGETADIEAKYSVKAKKSKDEEGNPTVHYELTEKTRRDPSVYAKIFDETNPYWDDSAEYNKMFLLKQQDYCNEQLKANGRLFLNDVYKVLGFTETKAGQVVGWIYDENDPVGDNYIDFGIYDVKNSQKCAFVNGFEKSIILDFNVDGNIWEMM